MYGKPSVIRRYSLSFSADFRPFPSGKGTVARGIRKLESTNSTLPSTMPSVQTVEAKFCPALRISRLGAASSLSLPPVQR